MEPAKEQPQSERPVVPTEPEKISFWRYVVIALVGISIGVAASYGALIYSFQRVDTPVSKQTLGPISLSNFDDSGSIESLRAAIEQNLDFLESTTAPSNFFFGTTTVSNAVMLDAYRRLQELTANEDMAGVTKYIQEHFQAYEVNDPNVLVTGYFEAELEGSLTKTEDFNYPLYRIPRDLITLNLKHFKSSIIGDQILTGRLNPEGYFLPYYTRKEIDYEAALANKADVLVWLKDPIDAFFLHIQGSGIVRLSDGSTMSVNYAGKNGREYRAIGRLLINKGVLTKEDVSMQSIQEYLRAHPEVIEEVFSYNPSYVFFRPVPEGPIGNLGIPVTAYRSIATDQSVYPKGALAFLSTRLPIHGSSGEIVAWQEFSQFVINQDTGGAIRGGNRVDLFTGNGPQAELHAGALKESGRLVVFAPK